MDGILWSLILRFGQVFIPNFKKSSFSEYHDVDNHSTDCAKYYRLCEADDLQGNASHTRPCQYSSKQ